MFTKESQFRDVVKKAVGLALEGYVTGQHSLQRIRGQLALIRSWRAISQPEVKGYHSFNMKDWSEKEVFLDMLEGDLDGLVKGESLYTRTYNTCMYLNMWENDRLFKEKEDAALNSND